MPLAVGGIVFVGVGDDVGVGLTGNTKDSTGDGVGLELGELRFGVADAEGVGLTLGCGAGVCGVDGTGLGVNVLQIAERVG